MRNDTAYLSDYYAGNKLREAIFKGKKQQFVKVFSG